MRIRRVAVRHVRGVVERVVRLLPDDAVTGVTIVEGPNEVGKSSLADALDALLACKDSSRSRHVRSLQSPGVDEGPMVEADLDAGPYRFTYRKRFLKRPLTELRVHAPRLETLSGDEAHARVQSMLDQTVDRSLWDRLRIRQGAGREQVALADSRGLVTRLQERSVADAFGDREAALFELVRAAYAEHFTDSGRERVSLRSAAERVRQCADEVAALEERRAGLRADVERVAALDRDHPRRRRRAADAQARAAGLAGELEAIERLEGLVRERRFAHAAARAQADAFAAALRHRERLRGDLTAADERHTALQRPTAEDAALLEDAAAAVTAAERALDERRAEHVDARRRLDAAEQALDHRRRQAALDRLSARHRRARDALDEVAALERAIRDCPVDEALLAELRDRQRTLDHTEAELAAASPQVLVTATRPLTVLVDGVASDLAGGESLSRPVGDVLDVVLPAMATVRVRSGTSVERALRRREEAAARLDDLLLRASAADFGAAEAAFARLPALRAALDAARRRLDDELDGRTMDELSASLTELRHAQETTGTAAPGTMAEVEAERHAAGAHERRAAAALAAAVSGAEEARALRARRAEDGLERRLALGQLEREISRLGGELSALRAEQDDEALAAAAHEADAALVTATAALAEARAALDAAEPVAVRARLGDARAAADDATSQLRTSERERAEIRAAIRARGDDGLHERHAAALAALEHARAAERSLRRRAASARLLHATLAAHRAAAQERYVAPLHAEIVRLGRLLHGREFDVELDDDLRVARRHLGGLWLALDELSLGAQEQLALLARLACASLVADDAGGFLLLDDALGHTDRERLDALGAVLRLAGERCQVVVLTCFPERYEAVGGARRISLP